MRTQSRLCLAALLIFSICAAPPAQPSDIAAADAAFAAGEAEKAEKLYEKLADGNSTVARVYRNLATLYDQSRRGGAYTEKAESLYRKAIALDAKDALAHYQLGLHLNNNGKGADSIAEFRAAVKLDAKHADARYWLARSLQSHNQGEKGEAEALYKQAIAIDPEHANSYFFLGQLLANEGRKAEAAVIFKKGQATKPREGHKRPDDFADALENLN